MSDRTVYDEVPYSSYPYADTHPDRLAAIAALHGVSAPEPSTARVLELGCGAGGNLLAMTVATPGITAVGVDLSRAAIGRGTEIAAAVGIDNLSLRHGDITQLTGGELGEFDFVIAHGIYTWVPEPVRDALLAAVESHLAADGVAYISYNANPGGLIRRSFREAGLWFARGAEDPTEMSERARVLFRFLVENRAGTDDWWGGLLENQVPALANGSVAKLVHDDLSECWSPVWFADFAAHAASHRLAYVGDANLTYLLPGRVPDAVASDMYALVGDDRIAQEQLHDLMRCVFFRQTILCRDSRRPVAMPTAEAMTALHFAARGEEEIPEGLTGAAVDLLRSRAPGTVAFAELRSALGAEADALGSALLEAFDRELVMPHSMPVRPYMVSEVERPVASPLARWQAQRGPEITSLAYRTVMMEEPAARVLITLLDGTRDRTAVRAEFTERTGVRLSAGDLEANLEQLARIFVLG